MRRSLSEAEPSQQFRIINIPSFWQLCRQWDVGIGFELSCASMRNTCLEWEGYICSRKNFVFLLGALIWPLGSTHIFTQSGWLILFIPDYLSGQHQIGESRQTLSLPQNFFVQDRRNDCPLSSIAAAPPPWGKPSNLWTPCVYSLGPRVPSWIWIRRIQYATHRNNF